MSWGFDCLISVMDMDGEVISSNAWLRRDDGSWLDYEVRMGMRKTSREKKYSTSWISSKRKLQRRSNRIV